jgi:hypothetical protein
MYGVRSVYPSPSPSLPCTCSPKHPLLLCFFHGGSAAHPQPRLTIPHVASMHCSSRIRPAGTICGQHSQALAYADAVFARAATSFPAPTQSRSFFRTTLTSVFAHSRWLHRVQDPSLPQRPLLRPCPAPSSTSAGHSTNRCAWTGTGTLKWIRYGPGRLQYHGTAVHKHSLQMRTYPHRINQRQAEKSHPCRAFQDPPSDAPSLGTHIWRIRADASLLLTCP